MTFPCSGVISSHGPDSQMSSPWPLIQKLICRQHLVRSWELLRELVCVEFNAEPEDGLMLSRPENLITD